MQNQIKTVHSPVRACAEALLRNGLSIAFVEIATGGRLTAEFSLVKDSGKFLKGGIVCYNACVNERILFVPEMLIKTYTGIHGGNRCHNNEFSFQYSGRYPCGRHRPHLPRLKRIG